MKYSVVGNPPVKVSKIALGGHEYLPEGGLRGFGEEFELAIKPGVNFEGFGGDRRRNVVETALGQGVNFFDVTIDEEKDALGRNLSELGAHEEVFVQTRPANMCYGYDEYNTKMIQYDTLREEVKRSASLLQRDRIYFLNFGIEYESLEYHDNFLGALEENVKRLKHEELISYACFDCLSRPVTNRESAYLQAIETGAFDAINVNINFADQWALNRIIPAAERANIAVFAREVFMKGRLFPMLAAADIPAGEGVAAAIRWIHAIDGITSSIVGAASSDECRVNASIGRDPLMTEDAEETINQVQTTEAFARYTN